MSVKRRYYREKYQTKKPVPKKPETFLSYWAKCYFSLGTYSMWRKWRDRSKELALLEEIAKNTARSIDAG